MKRRIIKIDKDLCNGCGACASACHEGAIGMVDGKAVLLRDDFCDGLGDCLPTCPTGAISFEEREAAAYDEAAVMENMKKRAVESGETEAPKVFSGCPGMRVKQFNMQEENAEGIDNASPAPAVNSVQQQSQLRQWPVQIKLVPIQAPFYDGANLLIAADCTAYAYAGFHQEFMKNHVTLIGCPKLDSVDYSEKLTEIIRNNNIKSVKVLRMEVPCCGGLENAVKKALMDSGKFLPWQVVTVSTDGRILE